MNNFPLISLILINYNGDRYLKACLETIVSQDLNDVEVIVADGKSSDDSLLIFEEYKTKIPMVVYSEKDRGINDAFRKALARASGDFVCHMCSTDGYADPNWFRLVKEICTKNKVDAIFSTTALKASGLFMAKSARTFRFSSILLDFTLPINWL